MISLSYSAKQIAGVWAMTFNQAGWEDKLDRSLDGVFKSFWVLIPSILFSMGYFWLLVNVQVHFDEEITKRIPQQTLMPGLITQPLSLFIQWAAGLGLLIVIAKKLKLNHHATDIVIGFNWLLLIQQLLSGMPIVGFALTRNMAVLSLLSLPVFFLSAYMTWGFLRRTLPQLDRALIAGIIVAFLFIFIISGALVASLAGLFIPSVPLQAGG